MRIGIDVREFRKGSYTGLRTIMRDFLFNAGGSKKHEFVFFGNQHTDLESLPGPGKKVVVEELNTFFWDQFQLPVALRREGVELFFTPYIKTPFWRACPYVNTVADLIPFVAPSYKGIRAVLIKIYFFLYIFISSRKAVRVITISNYSKKKISEVFGLDAAKIKVVYPSAGEPVSAGPKEAGNEFIDRYDLEKPYFLYLGNFKPHKNLSNLIAAFDLLPQEVKDSHRLFLVGGSGSNVTETERVIADRGLSGRIIPVAGGLSDSEISIFMKKASVFVFPSLVEGFGIPPVEAMAAGVPVASSDLLPMTEVLGDAALFFDPREPKSITKTILKLAKEEKVRKECIERGLKRASMFKSENMSQKIMDILEDAGEEKTLLVSSEFPPIRGGMATYISNLWTRLPEKKITVFTARSGGEAVQTPEEGLDVVRAVYPLGRDIFSRILRTIAVIWHVWQQNCMRNVRCNHCAQIISAGMAGLIVKKLKKTPFIVYAYSADVLEFSKIHITNWIMKKVFKECEHVIVCSDFAESAVVGNGFAGKEKITVLTPGVDTGKLNPEIGSGGVKGKYGIPDKRKMILTVSRLVARKGHDRVIEALKGVLESYPDVVYVIVGDGPERGGLELLVKEKGLQRNVVFTGEVPPEELTFFYNACDLFVMTPHYIKDKGDIEGFGTVFLEANACGKPVVAGKSGGVSEAVINERTGLLVDPQDAGQIRDAVLRFLKDEEYARKLGENGLLRVRKDFGWETRAEELGKYI
ncbi:MAG: glycosyltransferase [Candidatus Omnitrophota bacterium]